MYVYNCPNILKSDAGFGMSEVARLFEHLRLKRL